VQRRNRFQVLGMAVLCAGALSAPALPARAQSLDRTDLKIEIVGFPHSSKPRELHLRVSNVSKWWSADTRATVATVPSAPGDPLTLRIPDLDPKQQPQGLTPNSFEFTYTLATDCNGQMVRASVSPGVDWKGDPETNVDNNVVQAQVCPMQVSATPTAQSSPALGDPVDPNTKVLTSRPDPGAAAVLGVGAPVTTNTRVTNQGDAGAAAIPEAIRPGPHTLSLDPSNTLSTLMGTAGGARRARTYPVFPTPGYVVLVGTRPN
jgi:hypothetical protein